MTTAVLIHGGFHGGWSWKYVAEILHGEGWHVFAPSLTGVADRSHLATPDVGLEAHISDISSLIEYHDLDDVILCAHSAGGMVAAAVADRMSSRIRHVVYLDAMVPRDGQSFFDVIGEETGMPQYLRDQAAAGGHSWMVEPGPAFGPEGLGITDPGDAAWVRRHLSGHPLAAFADPVSLGGDGCGIPTTYVRAERLPAPTLDALLTSLGRERSWDIHRWDAGHDLMITEAPRVAALLQAIDSARETL